MFCIYFKFFEGRHIMIKKLILVLLMVGSIFSHIHCMKRAFGSTGEIESFSKKIKTDVAQRPSLFSLFEKNDLNGFARECEWRKLYNKDSLNEKDSAGHTILYVVDESEKRKQDEFFKILISNGADINAKHSASGMTVLNSAAIDLDFKRMKRALSAGADANIASAHGALPLSFLSAEPGMKFYPEQFEVLNMLCAKTDLTTKARNGSNIMHNRMLQKPIAERLLLYGADVDVLNAGDQKPQDTCWVFETRELLASREAARDKVIMPALALVAQSRKSEDSDNFADMPHGVSKLFFDRQIIGPKYLNRHRLTFVGK